MKKGLLLIVLLLFGWAGVASALSFSDTIDFTGNTFEADGITKTGIFINDTGNTIDPGLPGYNFAFTYTHNVDFNPAASKVNSAFLDLTYSANRADSIEAWFVYGQGDLEDTQNTVWKKLCWFISYPVEEYSWAVTTFDLSELIAGIGGNSWAIAFSIDENTSCENEQMFLAESKVYGDYAPVPEPATLFLLGSGLAGLALYRRKRVK